MAAAVRLGTAIFPAGTQQRLVLLSDGNDTAGQAEQAILSAAEHGVRLDVVVPGGGTHPEALVDGVDAPAGARVGETIELKVRVRSTVETTATLRLLADGATIATRQLSLTPGTTAVSFTVKADEPGFHVFRAVLEPRQDHFTENNAADAYVLVTGEPQILVATDDAARAADLVDALPVASPRRWRHWPGTTPWCSTTSRRPSSVRPPWPACRSTCATWARGWSCSVGGAATAPAATSTRSWRMCCRCT